MSPITYKPSIGSASLQAYIVRGCAFLFDKGIIMYAMDNKKFAGKITSIKATTGKMRDLVQDALIAATYLCLKNSGGTTPFQQILDAVGTAAHRQGIVRWAETFAPVMLRDEKLVLNVFKNGGKG